MESNVLMEVMQFLEQMDVFVSVWELVTLD